MTDTAPLAERVHETTAGPARLLLLPTDVRDVVSFRGSFDTGPDLGENDDLTQAILSDLLDKGTRRRDRFEIAEALDGRGASVSFYSDSIRMGFAGRALRDDLADVLAIVAEELREPALDPEEVQKAVVRAVAGVRRARESTSAQASGAFARRLYPPSHPNYRLDPEIEIELLEAITPESVRAYHEAHVGADAFTVALVGDLPEAGIERVFADAFGGWASTGREAAYAAHADPEPPGRTVVEIADRRNLDVRIGHAVDLQRQSPDFLGAFAGVFALGGNFSSRLMQTVRDEQGLTYGVDARLRASPNEHDGYVRVGISLSQENLERGIAAVRKEVETYVAEGITADALRQTQTTLAGQHVVALATTGGLAARLLVNAQRGFDVGYLDRYPDLVHALTEAEVNEALRRYVRPEDLQVAIAGTVPD